MVVDLSDLVTLHSYCNECIDEFDRVKLFDVSRRFRHIYNELDVIIEKEQLEEEMSHNPKD